MWRKEYESVICCQAPPRVPNHLPHPCPSVPSVAGSVSDEEATDGHRSTQIGTDSAQIALLHPCPSVPSVAASPSFSDEKLPVWWTELGVSSMELTVSSTELGVSSTELAVAWTKLGVPWTELGVSWTEPAVSPPAPTPRPAPPHAQERAADVALSGNYTTRKYGTESKARRTSV